MCEANARRGDIDDVIATIDTFAYEKSILINVGDEKGELLDAAVRRANPELALELGTYCGYGSLRIARAAPAARVFSVELAAGQCRSGATYLERMPGSPTGSPAWSARSVTAARPSTRWPPTTASPQASWTLLFIDHDKAAYLADLQSHHRPRTGCTRGSDRGRRQHSASPAAPEVPRAYMREQQGKLFDTVEHKTHGEYQTLAPDLVLESEYLG